MTRSSLVLMFGTLLVCASTARGQVFHDDFNVFYNWVSGGVGSVPPGGIWTGINNATNGGTVGTPGIVQSNGADFGGTPHPGTLYIEDLNLGAIGGTTGMGFEGNRNTAVMPFIARPASDDWDAKVKITAQTSGMWSGTGIVARLQGPPIGVSPLDPAEQFVTALSFRTDAANPGNGNMLTKSIVGGAQVVDAQTPWVDDTAATPTPNATLPVYVRLLKSGTTFTSMSSLDGTTWFTETVVSAPALATAGGTIQIGPSFMMFGGSAGTTDIDSFDLSIGLPPATDSTWLGTGGGNWNTATNWNSSPTPLAPNNNQVTVHFDSAITAPSTIFTDSNVTAKKLIFNNANKYAIAGTGTITMDANAGNASIAVNLGSHEIQAAMSLNKNLDITAAASTRLDINNKLALNGKTVSITGAGTVSINNNVVAGAVGAVVSSAILQGAGTINGDLTNSAGGTVAPGNSAGKLTVVGNFSQAAGATLDMELAGAAAGQFDRLVVGGSLTAAGALKIDLINGFNPVAGNSFDLLDFASHTGTFTLNLPALSGGLSWNTANLLSTGVVSVIGAGNADFNGDGHVDGADFLIWQRGLGSGTTHATGDADGNSVVNSADLAVWKGQFGSVVAASGAVPEPTTCVLALGGVLVLGLRRRA